jgi:hypothetical protein
MIQDARAGVLICREPLGDRALWASVASLRPPPANLVQRGLLRGGTRRIGRSTVQRATSRPLPQQTPRTWPATSSSVSVHRSDQLRPAGESGLCITMTMLGEPLAPVSVSRPTST